MHLIQLFLPLRDGQCQPFDRAHFARVRTELTEAFGGVTAYQRSPAVGLWEAPDGEVERDDVVLFEVMADQLDHAWWTRYRKELAARFVQDEVMVRACPCERL
ncbi:hypothetical protein [Agrilutibacter solisilvae]|uniref:Uncharacterized protein n=1 Tax=Agrilutibacter solisilvae TaxID=2763317 RepID=A0A974XWM9_9GAMM|nr:hypothetical protein [Lysobacter solisilvae]QSX77083.1 hypothetical protein I8J32_009715 [Lysobacter solisilvae]